ncbi:hypothetical protein [Lysinibacillus fusiformis]|uniref:Lipoprotein n=1 Tax=Lysinibacillus fusiformis TaxID=28031 RepID=A0A1H9SGA8_9BACI|nr:hypothetical protein [Lysinibacillus fusiformis]SCY84019.1 hypothetical protein SAMN02787081_04714 [Lysinibacillus fusiformis]SEO54173.1 hypothetical protein SAMN02787103_04687 [Lysinibacillus fusiformis]SER84007.1 hypothetical protein SAMN02787113_04719 [Lysinibacillus fusiformis]
MKVKAMLIVLGLSSLFFLSGCGENEEKVSVTFLQLEKQNDFKHMQFLQMIQIRFITK